MRTLLVISYEGEDPDEIAKKYTDEISVKPYVYMRRDEAETKQMEQLARLHIISAAIDSNEINLSERQQQAFKENYWFIHNMTPDEYFDFKTNGLEIIDNVAYSTANPDAKYRYPTCYQSRLDKTGQEAEFSNPFHTKDGGVAYRAYMNDIDWERDHGYNKELYEKAWELCVEDKEPTDVQEQLIKNNMSNRLDYFQQFENKENYVRHSTSFFTYGVATSKEYVGLDFNISDMDWVAQYFDRFIKPIKGNPLLSIYEIRLI